ncbi:MAG: hypothetical protein KJ702_13315, partial [Gammaproteobacteria bacterium]|nr:hypothetical protein [Gammaproteobacteria bacterium]
RLALGRPGGEAGVGSVSVKYSVCAGPPKQTRHAAPAAIRADLEPSRPVIAERSEPSRTPREGDEGGAGVFPDRGRSPCIMKVNYSAA